MKKNLSNRYHASRGIRAITGASRLFTTRAKESTTKPSGIMPQNYYNAMEQAPIPDTSRSQRPTPFHGLDSEDINRWLDKVEHYLNLRRIRADSSTALAELILNLAGPAEDFYYSLDEERKDTFVALREALRERFSNENQSWIIWQAITTRQQGPVEPIDTYLNDLTSEFRIIKISDRQNDILRPRFKS